MLSSLTGGPLRLSSSRKEREAKSVPKVGQTSAERLFSAESLQNPRFLLATSLFVAKTRHESDQFSVAPLPGGARSVAKMSRYGRLIADILQIFRKYRPDETRPDHTRPEVV